MNETLALRRTEIVPITAPEQVQELVQAAAADHHIVIAPSHLAMKEGEVVGYASIGSIPLFNVWLDSRKVQALDSLRLLKNAEAMARQMGVRQYLMPCAHTSPFHPHMERLGFTRLGFSELNWKRI